MSTVSTPGLEEARLARWMDSHEDLLGHRYGFSTKEVQNMDSMVRDGLIRFAKRQENGPKGKQ